MLKEWATKNDEFVHHTKDKLELNEVVLYAWNNESWVWAQVRKLTSTSFNIRVPPYGQRCVFLAGHPHRQRKFVHLYDVPGVRLVLLGAPS